VNSGFYLEALTYDLWSVVKASPEGLFNVLTKPWPSEVNNILFVPAFIENITVIVLLVVALLYCKAIGANDWDFVAFCLSFCIILFVVIGLTTPITGAIVRYKIPAIPFLFMAVFMFMDHNKLPKALIQNKLSRWINTFL
jgi:NADH:ubiquinone oxidoreductase subunit 3 (subunit A)